MKPRYLYQIIIGLVLIVSGFVVIPVTNGESFFPAGLEGAGFALLVNGIIRHRRYGDEPDSDERSKKIGAYGLSYAWMTGLLFMTALLWLDYADVLVLGTRNALAASVLVLALSAVVYQAWLFRKGDVGI